MPEKTKTYERVIFPPEVIKEAVVTLETTLPRKHRTLTYVTRQINLSLEEEWEHDTDDEFFADYLKDFMGVRLQKNYVEGSHLVLSVYHYLYGEEQTRIAVRMPSRSNVEKIFSIFDSNMEKCRLPKLPIKVKVFIGHGHNAQWRDLKDHLHDKHGFEVEHYERGSRAGLTIKEVLDDMLDSSSFALLVLTGEDQDAEGELHARENVIHELGLFQGGIGWEKAIALLEGGVKEFSNIHGMNQIRFSKGNIRETFGEVVAAIKREFPENE